MLRILVEGFTLGLIMAPLCAVTCAPVFLSFALSRDEKRLGRQAMALGEFLLGRLIGYAAVGLVFGWLGSRVSGGPPPALSILANGVLGIALLLYAVSQTTRRNIVCKAIHRWGSEGRYPLVLGMLTGLNICPPFIAGIKRVTDIGGAGLGLAFFFAFFLATTITMIPMLGVSFANLLPAVRSIARVGCAGVGLIFLCHAAAAFNVGPVPNLTPSLGMAEVESEAALDLATMGGVQFLDKTEPVPHKVVMVRDRPFMLVVYSKEFAPEIEGYGGHVPLAVTLNLKGRIAGVELLPGHEEEPGYYDVVKESDLLLQFVGKHISDQIEVGQDIDAVSGATITSRAIADGVRVTARRAAEKLFPLYEAAAATPPRLVGPEAPIVKKPFHLNPWHLAIFLLVGAAIFADLRRISWMRYVLLAVSFLFLGVWQQTFFSVKHALDIVMLGFPPFRTHAVWYILVVSALGSALVTGRVYCAYVCPFGAISEIVGRLSGSPIRVSAEYDRKLRRIKYFVLIALAVLYAATRNSRLLLVEPFADAFSLGFLSAGGDAALRAGWIVLLLIMSVLVSRFFCRYLCPAGAAMAFLARHRLLGRIRPDKCVECGECMVSCPKREGRP